MPEIKEKSELTIDLKPSPRLPNDPVWVIIDGDANGNMSVRPDPFWLDRNEHVEFFCNLPHSSHGPNCFTVTFDKPDLFGSRVFGGHHVATGEPQLNAKEGIQHKYKIEAAGFKTLDPGGGVKPRG
jgi:hypothetical protein